MRPASEPDCAAQAVAAFRNPRLPSDPTQHPRTRTRNSFPKLPAELAIASFGGLALIDMYK